MKTNDERMDLDTLRALVALQPRGRAQLARAAGISLPNLSAHLRTGLESLVSKPLRDRFHREIGLTASGWLRAGCHVWRTDNVEDVVLALGWCVPKGARVSVREFRREDEPLDDYSALVHLYLLRWSMHGSPRRVLLQLRVTEQAAVDARNRLIECGILDVGDGRIPVAFLAPPEHEKLSDTSEITNKAFDDLLDREVEITWDMVFNLLPTVFESAALAHGVLQSIAAAWEVSKATRRARGRKPE